jgi:hypothetical protein
LVLLSETAPKLRMMVVMERKSLPLHKYPVNEPVPFETGSLDEMSAGARAGYPHRHDFHEILYITRGTGAHVIDLIPYPVEPPVLFFVSPGQVHFWEQGATIAGRVLIFTMEFLVHDPVQISGGIRSSLLTAGWNRLTLLLMQRPSPVSPVGGEARLPSTTSLKWMKRWFAIRMLRTTFVWPGPRSCWH